MNWEPGIVRTVNLGYEQLHLIETRDGASTCVIFRGVLLGRRAFARSGDPRGGSDYLEL